MGNSLLEACAELLYREADLLDRRCWTDWLALYAEDAEFWIPAWHAEEAPTQDPRSEISLMYYETRVGLEERVWRITSGLSAASNALPRTCHMVTNVRLTDPDEDRPSVSARFQATAYRPGRGTHSYFGTYEYRLARTGGELRIRAKKIILINDALPDVLDIYAV